MIHEDSKRKRRVYYFLAFTLLFIFLLILVSVILFVPLVTEGLMSISWVIFFIGFNAILIALDFIWFSTFYSKTRISNWVKRGWRKDRFYYRRMRREHELLEKHLERTRDPSIKQIYRDALMKRMLLFSLACMELIILAIWAISIGSIGFGPIYVIGLMSFFILLTLWIYYDENKKRKIKKVERMEKQKRELKKFQSSHSS